jgi:Uma2 family endonuclease
LAERDLEVKLPFYERAGTPEVWLTDLSAEITEIYLRPASDGYRETLWVKRAETVASLTMTDLQVAADDILG